MVIGRMWRWEYLYVYEHAISTGKRGLSDSFTLLLYFTEGLECDIRWL